MLHRLTQQEIEKESKRYAAFQAARDAFSANVHGWDVSGSISLSGGGTITSAGWAGFETATVGRLLSIGSSTANTGGVQVGYAQTGVQAMLTSPKKVMNTSTPVEVEQEYNPELVARVLKAASEPAEAIFDSFDEMMDWLDRD
jgi:hypothetical protein